MRVLVTGASGSLGSGVCRALAQAGLGVRAADRTYRGDLPVPVEVADLMHQAAAYPLLQGCDAVVHLANHPNPQAGVPPQQIYSDNVTLDVNVFQAAAHLGVRNVVFASSVQVFAGSRTADDQTRPSCLPYLPIDGDLPARPGNAYALSKEAGEQQLRYFCALDPALKATSVRFPALIIRDSIQWIRRMRRLRASRFPSNPDEGMGYLSVEDAASLVLAALLKQRPGYHQVLPSAPDNFQSLTVPQMIERFFAGVPVRKHIECEKSIVDPAPLREELGWSPRDTDLFDQDGVLR